MKEYSVFVIIVMTLSLFIWGRWRYDVVACLALMATLSVGALPFSYAFTGFSNPAVITVATVMIITQVIMESGVLNKIVVKLTPATSTMTMHITILTGLAAVLSAFMNNVGALALTMPIALQTAAKHKRSPTRILMPIAFGSILGGLTTLIGTPPNIIIAVFRQEKLGKAFNMFDFMPVGLAVALVGVCYIVLLGWRFLPQNRVAQKTAERYRVQDYITEVRVPGDSPLIGKTISDLESFTLADFLLLGYIRDHRKRLNFSEQTTLMPGDILIIEANPGELEKIITAGKLQLVGSKDISVETLRSEEVSIIEAVVVPGTKIEGRTPQRIKLRERYHLNLIAISRRGQTIQQRLKNVKFQAGDVLLLQGNTKTLYETVSDIGFLPLAEAEVKLQENKRIYLPSIIFLIGLVLAACSILPAQIAFAGVVLVMVLLNLTPMRRVYDSIDWSIVVLLGAMIPVGQALQLSGGTDLIAKGLIAISSEAFPVTTLAILMIITILLTDVINNAATAVLMAPIGLSLADKLGYNPDAFLMVVAVAASSAFLTPIGHQNNTLVMGPGGYHFGDYWRMGLLLDIFIILVSLPMILWVWPL